MKSLILLGKKVLLAVAIPALLFIAVRLLFPSRINLSLLLVLLMQAIPPAILAWGVCFEIKVSLWDFSVGAITLVSGIVGAGVAEMLHLGIWGIVALCTLSGLLIGLSTGVIFSLLKIPSIIVSIGIMLILESVSGLIFKGQGVIVSSDIFKLASFPLNLVIGFVAFALAYYIYNYRRLGFHVRAVGNGITVARLNGINVDNVRILCFTVTGMFAGVFSFMQLAGSAVMKAQNNMTTMGVVVDAIICACIALSLEGVANLIVGVFIGSVTIQILKIGILVSGFPSMYQQVVVAIFLLIFMGLSSRSDLIHSAWARLRSPTAGRA